MRRRLVIGTSLTLIVTGIIGQAYSQSVNREFEALSACRKLDVIASDGKSVTQYIFDSGFDQFANDVVSECPRHLEELGQAWDRMVADPERDMFLRLSPCAQLNAIETDGKSVVNYIVSSGYEPFARTVLQECPQHLTELGTAWRQLNPVAIASTEQTSALSFEELPPCNQLDVINSEPDKSVADFIFGSGIEVYEAAIRDQCDRHLGALREARQMANRTVSSSPGSGSLQIAQDFPAPANTGLNSEFESLAPCQKLDVVQGEGKSVPRYIADSGPEEFSNEIYSMCRRHINNLIEAERLLGRAF